MPAMKPLLPSLGAKWWQDIDDGPLELFLRLEALGGDVAWLEDAVEGRHILAAGGERATADSLDEIEFGTRPSFGWIDYELGLQSLGVAAEGEARWMRVDRWIVVEDGRAQLQSTGAAWMLPAPEGQKLSGRPFSSSEVAHGAVNVRPVHDDEGYAEMVREVQRWITEGDSYLACLTTSYSVDGIDPVRSYLALRQLSPAHRGGFIRIDGRTIASISPERFISFEHGVVRTRPIKGTRKRDPDPESDTALAQELLASEKERAENVMIVDLCRNDLHLVCEPGTVSVSKLLAIESYSAVHQLVSTIEGRVRAGCGTNDVVKALFPAGSMVGTPKARTAELLRQLEGRDRGTYSGCFGVATRDFAQLTMTIRALVEQDGHASIGVGGGVTALSDVEAEVAEVRLKAEAILRSLRTSHSRGVTTLRSPRHT